MTSASPGLAKEDTSIPNSSEGTRKEPLGDFSIASDDGSSDEGGPYLLQTRLRRARWERRSQRAAKGNGWPEDNAQDDEEPSTPEVKAEKISVSDGVSSSPPSLEMVSSSVDDAVSLDPSVQLSDHYIAMSEAEGKEEDDLVAKHLELLSST